MFPLGHLGIGSKLVAPWTSNLPKRFVLLGTLLPDLIDKPIYAALTLVTGRRGAELGLLSGTRTVGHTAIFLLMLVAAAAWRRSRILAALCLGCMTHLLLDSVSERFSDLYNPDNSAIIAILFPWFGIRFPVASFASVGEQFWNLAKPHIWVPEIAGALILSWDYWKSAHLKEIRRSFRERRIERKLRRQSRRHARS